MQPLTIVTVTYNSSEVIAPLLESLHSPDWEILVVDNGSQDGCQAIAATFTHVRVIQNGNIGYGRAANVGFREANTPYVLLVNPDVAISSETIDQMLACLKANPDIGILGANMTGEPAEGLVDVDWIVGALMLIRREALVQVGLFDEQIFLFYEESDMCNRFLQAGWRLAVLQSAVAEHDVGTSSPASLKVQKIKAWHFAWSKCYYYRKHFSTAQYIRKCLTRVASSPFRIGSGLLTGNSRRVVGSAYELLGALAYLGGMSAFRKGVGRLT